MGRRGEGRGEGVEEKGREEREKGDTEKKRGIPSTHRLVLRSSFSILLQDQGQSALCPLGWIGGQVHACNYDVADRWIDG